MVKETTGNDDRHRLPRGLNRLTGKVAIVTGGAQGIGYAIATRFVEEGAAVVITDIDGEAAVRSAAALQNSIACHHDVAEPESWDGVLTATLDAFERVDVLVNNAGVVHHAAIVDTDLADFERVMRTNQVGTFLGIKSAVPHMRERGGAIVNISSVRGISAANGLGAYVASKFAVRGLTKVAALELGKYGIRVNSVHPGAVATEGVLGVVEDLTEIDDRFIEQPIGRIGRPDDVASMAAFLASDDAAYCTGAEFLVDGGVSAGVRRPGTAGY